MTEQERLETLCVLAGGHEWSYSQEVLLGSRPGFTSPGSSFNLKIPVDARVCDCCAKKEMTHWSMQYAEEEYRWQQIKVLEAD